MLVYGKYFYGNEISEYGQKKGYVDYATLAKAFDAVLNNHIIEKTQDIGYWEQESGFIDNLETIEELQEQKEALDYKLSDLVEEGNEEEADKIRQKIYDIEEQIEVLQEEQDNSYNIEIYQYYIVSSQGAEILAEINEIVFYNEELNMYVWGVTHWGTAWDYVLTDIKCNVPYND